MESEQPTLRRRVRGARLVAKAIVLTILVALALALAPAALGEQVVPEGVPVVPGGGNPVPSPPVPELPPQVPTPPPPKLPVVPAPPPTKVPSVPAPPSHSPAQVPAGVQGGSGPSAPKRSPSSQGGESGRETAVAVPGIAASGTSPPTGSVSRNGSPQSDEAAAGAGGQAWAGGTATRPTAPAVGEAEAAPLGRLLAYVWPAVALGPAVEVLATFLPDAMLGQGDRSPSAPTGWARLFSPASLLGGSSGGDRTLSERIATATTSSQPTSGNSPLADGDGGMSLLATLLTVVAALIGVVALARLTVGEEFFSTRWLH